MKLSRGRYWFFGFNKKEPAGGLSDLLFSFNNVEEFEDRVIGFIKFNHYQILDTSKNFHFEGDLGTVTKWVCKNIGDENYRDDL